MYPVLYFDSISKLLQSTYYAPRTTLDTGDTAGNKTDKVPSLVELILWWGRYKFNK